MARIGIVGAGTMGSGIALSALYAGHSVTLVDSAADVLEQAQAYIRKFLDKREMAEAARHLTSSTDLAALEGSEIVIEAAPEDLELKRQLFAELDRICPEPALLTTNTSTLPITAIASVTSSPERVAGMHFFNPAPVMELVEVARGSQTAPSTIDRVVELATSMGKTPIVTLDTPGFIVNRVARPFYGEALRILGEGAATHEQIDTIMTLGAGFRLGPFALMDLIGIDVNFTAATVIYETSFGEPRFRPHWIQRQMVQAGSLGRKTGRGYYTYTDGERDWDPPELPEVAESSGRVRLVPPSTAMVRLFEGAGYRVAEDASGELVAGVVTHSFDDGAAREVARLDRELSPIVPILAQTVDVTRCELAQDLAHPERLIGFDHWSIADGRVATLVGGEQLSAHHTSRVEELVRSIGRLPVWIAETPGLVFPRVLSALANEAAFALAEGVADAEAIDTAMRLGVNYPHGPLEWAGQIGYEQVVSVLEHLQSEFGEERYRTAPQLRKWLRQH